MENIINKRARDFSKTTDVAQTLLIYLVALLTPLFLAHSTFTGIVAAEDWVPTAVKYPGIWFFNILKGFLPVITPAAVNCITRYTICNGITTK